MNRYSRNIKVIGEDGQQKLASSSVIIVGCGALGGQLSMLLAAAGVGRIGIADYDTIDISNLQRQLFFGESIVGRRKAEILGQRMADLNSETEIIIYNKLINKANSREILSNYDVIADATDNPATKYFIDEAARSLSKPCCIGGVSGWRGQVAFLTNKESAAGLTYKDIFPMPEEDTSMLPCEIEGVMGPTASTIASLQASEILQYLITQKKNGYESRMTVLDLTIPSMDVIKLG